jgi:hypothetical protein
MLLEDIREEVKLIVQDDSFTDDMVDNYINDTYLSVIGQCLVPELKGIDTVVTVLSQSYTSLTGVTGGFSGNLTRVYNSEGVYVSIFNTLENLISSNGLLTDVGNVIAVALEGTTLWYYPVPEIVETLTLIYYRNPVALVSDSDSPDAIPEFLHRQILVNGASSLCFDTIEGGVEGVKINTQSRDISKREGMIRFREWLGKTRKHYIFSQEPF